MEEMKTLHEKVDGIFGYRQMALHIEVLTLPYLVLKYYELEKPGRNN
ncbi:hypothetical protein [Bacillus sp. B1-b2]|nr:hypothetical protein [Bacillus sp. B1-b2]